MHIANGVNMDQGADASNYQHHRHRQDIHPECPGNLQLPNTDPLHQGYSRAFRMPNQGVRQQNGDHEGQPRGKAGNYSNGTFTYTTTYDNINQQPDDWYKDNQGH